MYVENYRLDIMIGGESPDMIPYPNISDEQWLTWKAFLPVKSEVICKKELLGRPQAFLHTVYGIPTDVCQEMTQGARHFDEIEVWGKRKISKDPIAVGLTGNGERYLICRWGMDKLIPFERIKSRSWLYQIENFAVTLLTSAIFWVGGAAATLLAMSYIAGQK